MPKFSFVRRGYIGEGESAVPLKSHNQEHYVRNLSATVNSLARAAKENDKVTFLHYIGAVAADLSIMAHMEGFTSVSRDLDKTFQKLRTVEADLRKE